MPITKSAIKAMKQASAAKARNEAVKADFRLKVKTVRKAVAAGSKNVDEVLSKAIQAIDKAAKRNVIHKSAASRRKSRLMLAVNKATGKVVVPITTKDKTVAKPKAKKTSKPAARAAKNTKTTKKASK